MSWLKDTFDFFKESNDPFLKRLFKLTLVVVFLVVVFFAVELITGHKVFINGSANGVDKASSMDTTRSKNDSLKKYSDLNTAKSDTVDETAIEPDTGKIKRILTGAARANNIKVDQLTIKVVYQRFPYDDKIERYAENLNDYLQGVVLKSEIDESNTPALFEDGVFFQKGDSSQSRPPMHLFYAKVGPLSHNKRISIDKY